ncbi:MAG: hypothetical protein JO018_01165 [Candidatus Eremiobacteraeota bacterium]|nr:hypothetical protein [Candidatus Eremiobacteraeota bacterium]
MPILRIYAGTVVAALLLAMAGCTSTGTTTGFVPNNPGAPSPLPTTSPLPSPTPTTTPRPTPTPTTTPRPTPTPTHTPSPTPSPTSTPGGAITLNPTEVDLSPQGTPCANKSGNFTASEPGYSGLFTVSGFDPTIAVVTPPASSGTFTATSVTTNNGGGLRTTATVRDTLGHSAVETIRIAICLP